MFEEKSDYNFLIFKYFLNTLALGSDLWMFVEKSDFKFLIFKYFFENFSIRILFMNVWRRNRFEPSNFYILFFENFSIRIQFMNVRKKNPIILIFKYLFWNFLQYNLIYAILSFYFFFENLVVIIKIVLLKISLQIF